MIEMAREELGTTLLGEPWGGGFKLDQFEAYFLEKALHAIILDDERFALYRWVHCWGYDLITVGQPAGHPERMRFTNLPTFYLHGVWGRSGQPFAYWRGNQPDGSWEPSSTIDYFKNQISNFVKLSTSSFPQPSAEVVVRFL